MINAYLINLNRQVDLFETYLSERLKNTTYGEYGLEIQLLKKSLRSINAIKNAIAEIDYCAKSLEVNQDDTKY